MVSTVHLAKPRGFCAGVVMAIEAVERAAEESRAAGRGDLAVYHSIVHNHTVVRRLEENHGVHFVEDLADLAGIGGVGDTVVFSAHGISPAVRREAARRGLATVDATCPLVTKVHSEAKRYAALGYHILLIGDSATHQEVIGTLGEAPESTTLVRVLSSHKSDPRLADPREVQVPDPDRVVVLTQTTLSVDDTDRTIELLRERFPRLTLPSRDDLCYATKNRQGAVREIAPKVDLFLVVTSTHSSNGMRLLELAEDLTGNARRVESLADVRPEWLEGVGSVGITSAASTPDDLVLEIVEHFRSLNPALTVVEEGTPEDIEFRKPERVPAPANA
ncbi:MAG TPA: 4-hydroxy-3-methylbut-2-enyl diphosphate reductase [Deinococcales bacterium]|nr:4-hydroxy-3-methylbut-2-enyl diphosphate reductase [Deinococcales bacterium]